MPKLTPGDLHVNQPLTQIMIAYAQGVNNDFIADRVFPVVPTEHQSDFYYKFGRRAYLQTNAKKRAPGTETAGVDWTVTKDSFYSEVWGLHHDIEDQLRANADSVFALDKNGTELVAQQMLLRREKEWFNTFFKTGVWAVDMQGVTTTPGTNEFTQFDDAGSSPIQTFRRIKLEFMRRTGLIPNTAVFGPYAWDALIDHPEIVERIKYTQAAVNLSPELVAQAINIPRCMVANAVIATSGEEEMVADPAPDASFVASDGIWVGYVAPNASREIPSAGYTFSWKGYLGASAFGGRIKKFRMEPIASDRIEMEMAYSYKAVAPELGLFLNNVTSTP
jgi:hypothetical protein